jgi:hypothetical protein
MAAMLLGGCTDGMAVSPGEETTAADETTTADETTGSSGTPSTGALDTSGGETEDTGIEAGCGNGIVEASETCDERGPTATCDEDCTPVACGDGLVNEAAGEACETTDLAGGTCESLGLGVGTLACDDACEYATSGCAPRLNLSFSQVKRFDFSWVAQRGVEHYQILESVAPGEPYVQIGADVIGESVSLEMPLHFRWEASYVLRACSAVGCTDSAAVDMVGSLADAVGYIKASSSGEGDSFGAKVALSGDGNTLAVGASEEDSNATGIGGDEANDGTESSGAVYVFVRDETGAWSQQAYVKASNPGTNDHFGMTVALSGDGNTLAVGAYREGSSTTGIGGNQLDDSAEESGAVYVFVRDGAGAWSQAAYVKASNTGAEDHFGLSLALSGDGNTLAVGASREDSSATGIWDNQTDESAMDAGAVYVFVRDGAGAWSQQAYVKASNTGAEDYFGARVALSGDGSTLAVGAFGEDSNATGVGGNQADGTYQSGAVYLFMRNEAGAWWQQAYIKASNTGVEDSFGLGLALSGDGNTLAVGAEREDSNATGIGGNQADDSAPDGGAVYVFVNDGAGGWSQQAYLKASNTDADDWFGMNTALSADGDTLVVGTFREDSNATGIGGNQADDSAEGSGAVYVFVRDGAGAWSQEAYVKASNTEMSDAFGSGIALSGDGNILAAGARGESSSATGIGGDQDDDTLGFAGAVYLF